jgi:Domain of unknown function DUF29
MTIEQDFHGWLLDQAAALRARDYESLDWDHLAEEIEGMAVGERREMRNRLTTVFTHFLKLHYQPEEVRRHNSWRSSIIEGRRQMLNILDDSPGVFQGKREEVLTKTYNDARKDAALESGLSLSTFPEVCPWTYEQVVDEDFFPEVAKRDPNPERRTMERPRRKVLFSGVQKPEK